MKSRKKDKYEGNPRGFKLTVTDYDDIANRLEESLKQLYLVRDTLSTKENF